MFWSKILVSVMLILIPLNGYATTDIIGAIVIGIIQETFAPHRQNLEVKKPLYLETVNNKEFKKFLLEKNLIKGLKESDILWMDNAGNSYLASSDEDLSSSKILLTERDVYIISVSNVQKNKMTLNEKNYKLFDYDISNGKNFYQKQLKLHHDIKTTLINTEKLHIETSINDKILWTWVPEDNLDLIIKSRYNDIEKIKSIIDERVEYFKKLQADSAQK